MKMSCFLFLQTNIFFLISTKTFFSSSSKTHNAHPALPWFLFLLKCIYRINLGRSHLFDLVLTVWLSFFLFFFVCRQIGIKCTLQIPIMLHSREINVGIKVIIILTGIFCAVALRSECAKNKCLQTASVISAFWIGHRVFGNSKFLPPDSFLMPFRSFAFMQNKKKIPISFYLSVHVLGLFISNWFEANLGEWFP